MSDDIIDLPPLPVMDFSEIGLLKEGLKLEKQFDKLMTQYIELREATTELLAAVDGLFPTDGPVKARVRAALKEK
jgi:hypothetical protein